MADDFEISKSIIEEAGIGGTEELQEFSKATLTAYLTRFRLHQSRLEMCRIQYATAAQKVDDSNINTSILNQMKTIQAFDSSRGKAKILPEDELEELETFEEKVIQAQTNLQAGQQNIHMNANLNIFKQVMLEIGRDVYKLKQEVTGITEHFAFMYRGANRSGLKAVTVPVDTFFNQLLNNPDFNKVIQVEQRGSGFKDWSLRFNNSATKSVLGQLAQSGQGILHNINAIIDENGVWHNAMNLYDSLKRQAKNMYVPYKKLTKKERAKVDNDFMNDVLRVDYGYLVVRKEFQTGFIAQNIFNAYINQMSYKYETDRVAWYKGEDVRKNNSNIGYSVKSLLEQSPTLYAVNSVQNALTAIITTLEATMNLPINQIKGQLESAVFSAANEIGSMFSEDLNELTNLQK